MILPNVQKYEFLERPTDNFRALHTAVVNGDVLFCPKLGSIYTWWLPKTSPQNDLGGKLKHIDIPNKVSLWDTDVKSQIAGNHLNCYLVPMKDISYSFHEADGINFNIYVKHDGVFYATNVVDKKDVLTVVSISKDYKGTLYALEDNSVVYENLVPFQTTLDSWMTVDAAEGWDWNQTDNLIYPDDEVHTPRTPVCKKNLMDEFDNELHNTKQTMDLLDESSEESVMELTSGSEDDLDLDEDCEYDAEVASLTESAGDSDPEYEPSEQSDSTIVSDDSNHEQDDYDDYYDELRQDLDGSWNTRRQFYVYHGSDDAWDNLDPHVFLAERRDERDGYWYTKEQFFQYYGSYVIWKKMAPKKQLMRQTIYDIYEDATRLPERLQDSFIHRFLATY
jgi:hypothetical protein